MIHSTLVQNVQGDKLKAVVLTNLQNANLKAVYKQFELPDSIIKDRIKNRYFNAVDYDYTTLGSFHFSIDDKPELPTNRYAVIYLEGYGCKLVQIPAAFMDSKRYANGNEKTSREFEICLENFLDGLTYWDYRSILLVCHNNHPQPDIEFYFNAKNNKMLHFNGIGKHSLYYETKNKLTAIINGKRRDKFSFMPIHTIKTTCPYTSINTMKAYDGKYQRKLVNRYGSRYICKKYFEANFISCETCETLQHKNEFGNANYAEFLTAAINETLAINADNIVCDSCIHSAADDALAGAIKEWGFKPRSIFHTSKGTQMSAPKNLLFGIENEMMARDCDYNSYDHKTTAAQIAHDSDGFLYCKNDVSIHDGENDGFEVVSHPATFNALMAMDWNNMLLKHRENYKAYYTSTCGMHIHLSRAAFTDYQLYKFSRMLNKFKGFTHFISQRRRQSEYSQYARFSNDQCNIIKQQASDNIQHQKYRLKNARIEKMQYSTQVFQNDRYNALNLVNSQTVEVRTFKANLSKVSFLKNIEFTHALFCFCQNVAFSKQEPAAFVDYIKSQGKHYANLNIFLNERADDLSLVLQEPTKLI